MTLKNFIYFLVFLAFVALTPVTPSLAAPFSSQHPGFPYPVYPLPAKRADPALVYVPYSYGKVVTEIAPIYASVDIAKTGKAKAAARQLPIGQRQLTYISYQNEVVEDERRFYEIGSGEWMSAVDVHRVTPSSFQGVVFWRTPERDFGWMLKNVLPAAEPGAATTEPGAGTPGVKRQYEIVQIYETRKVGEEDWFLIGPGEWVRDQDLARVIVQPAAPQGVNAERWIEVNLLEQSLSVYDQKRLVFATLVSSGAEGHWTRPGVFQVQTKKETETMKLYDPTYTDNYLLEDVPYTMYFDQQRALHGSYWHNHFGVAGSRGCVNLSNGDSHWVFDWAKEGDYVYVWDPSGKTPTDASFYDAGGA